MQIPNEPRPGQPITAEWGRQVVRLLRALYPRPSPSVMPKVGAGGTSYDLRSQAGRGGTPACALECTNVSPSPGEKRIAVSWGTINGRQPTGFHGGGVPSFTLTPSGDEGWIFAKGTANHETLQWTAAAVVQDNNFAKPNTTTVCYRVIGSWRVSEDDGSLIVNSVCGNVDMDICELSAE